MLNPQGEWDGRASTGRKCNSCRSRHIPQRTVVPKNQGHREQLNVLQDLPRGDIIPLGHPTTSPQERVEHPDSKNKGTAKEESAKNESDDEGKI